MSDDHHLLPGGLYCYKHVDGIPGALMWDSSSMSSLVRKMKDNEIVLIIDVDRKGTGAGAGEVDDRAWLPGIGITVITSGILGWIYVGTAVELSKKRFVRI